jgi:hypothetical protein
MTRLPRTALTAFTIAAFACAAFAGPASAGEYRRHNDDAGAAIALGIGALVIGGILASKSKHRGHNDERHYRHAPPPRVYHENRHYAPPRVHRGPPAKERFND